MAYLIDPLTVLFADIDGKREARRAAHLDFFHEIEAQVAGLALYEFEGVVFLFSRENRDEDARIGLGVGQLDAGDRDERIVVRFAHEVFRRYLADVFGQSVVLLDVHVDRFKIQLFLLLLHYMERLETIADSKRDFDVR